MNNKKLSAIVFFVAFASLFSIAYAAVTVTLISPANNSFIRNVNSQNYTLHAETNSAGDNVDFYYSNDPSNLFQNYVGRNTTDPTFDAILSFNTSAVSDGIYNFTANASGPAQPNTTNYNITIDNTLPVITITAPTENQYVSGTNIWVNGTMVEANLLGNILINSSSFTNQGTNTSFAFKNNTAVPDGDLTVKVSYTDAAGNLGESTRHFIVDNTLPVITITTPTENQILTGSIYWINGTMVEANLFGNILINSTNFTNLGTNTSFSFENTSLVSDGNWTIRINYTDAAGNYNEAIRRFYVDNTAPGVGLNSPDDDSWNQLNYTVYFQFTPTDASGGFTNCSLWTNETGTFAPYNTTTLVNNSQVNTIIRNNVTNMSTGTKINWTVQCFDSVNFGSNITETGYRILKFDSSPPSQVGGFTPSSGSTWISLSWNAPSESGSGIKGYNVYRNDVLISSEQSATFINDTSLSCATTYNYKVSARDHANNSGMNSSTSPSTASCGTGGTGGDNTGGSSNQSLKPASFKLQNLTDINVSAGENTSITFKAVTSNFVRSLKNVQTTLEGIDNSWYSVEPNDFMLDVDDSKSITITFMIPADAEEKMYPVTITVAGKEVIVGTEKKATGALVLTVGAGTGQEANTGPTGAPFTFPTITLPTNITGIILMFSLIGGVALYIFREQVYGRLKEMKRPAFKGFNPQTPKSP